MTSRLLFAFLLAGCAASAEPAATSEEPVKAGLTGVCASTFGDQLTPGFGRIDGVIYAVQHPGDESCAMPNRDHVIVQVLMNGAVYRMVVNVKSDRPGADTRVRWTQAAHPLVGPAFSEGWHTGVSLDYARDLDVHTPAFAPEEMAPLVAAIESKLIVGAHVSVYAQSGAGRPESAHLVHRNKDAKDGAIVVNPTSDPTYLVFQFAEQTF